MICDHSKQEGCYSSERTPDKYLYYNLPPNHSLLGHVVSYIVFLFVCGVLEIASNSVLRTNIFLKINPYPMSNIKKKG